MFSRKSAPLCSALVVNLFEHFLSHAKCSIFVRSVVGVELLGIGSMDTPDSLYNALSAAQREDLFDMFMEGGYSGL